MGGVGLGLFLTKLQLDLLGSCIQVRSPWCAEHAGSEFAFELTLPRASDEDSDPPSPLLPAGKADGSPPTRPAEHAAPARKSPPLASAPERIRGSGAPPHAALPAASLVGGAAGGGSAAAAAAATISLGGRSTETCGGRSCMSTIAI